MATATKNELVVCIESHCSQAGDWTQGKTYRASDPVVRAALAAYPRGFAPADTPEAEWTHAFELVNAENDRRGQELNEQRKAEFERKAKANKKKLGVELVTAKRDIVGELDGEPVTVAKGSKLDPSHPFVLEHQEDFASK